MALFLQEDVTKLLWNKFVVIIGDSNQRSVYKDLVSLIQYNSYTKASDLKTKGELSFMDDQLLHGGRKGKMMNGVNYREVRQYKTDYHLVRFYFVTRSYNEYVQSIWDDLSGVPQPDIVIMNSCLWDVSRYGPTSMKKYKTNLERTFRTATESLPAECLFLWNTALPVANKIKGGFLLPELDFLCSTLRLDVLEGNFYAKELAGVFGLDVLDLHYFFRYQLHRRAADGVHWNHQAHRRITNLILTHIANAWGLDPPRHMDALSRGLPSPEKTKQPARVPSLPDALNFIDFDKPQSGNTSQKIKPKSAPAASGKIPDDQGKSEGSVASESRGSKDGVAKKSTSMLSDGNKVAAEKNCPKSAEAHQKSGVSHSRSIESCPKSAESRPKTLPSAQPGLLGTPPRSKAITSVVPRPRQNNRYAPYSSRNNNNNPPLLTGYCGPSYNNAQFNQYNNMVTMSSGYKLPQQMPYQSSNQFQADMQWRRQQRMNRMMHDRFMDLNWFGYNWS